MSGSPAWMIYGAGGYTGTMIAQHAHERGLRPILAGRRAPAVRALGDRLDLPHRVMALDEPAAVGAALADVELVLNAAGPFLHTAAPLAEACLEAKVHYLDISNELQVFRALYDLDARAREAGVTIVPGVGFGVVATNFLARLVSEAVGGAEHLDVAARAISAEAGPGAAATIAENLPYGGWIRRDGELQPSEIGSGTTTITLPDGPCDIMPVPTGDLEAAFRATGAPNVVASIALVEPAPGPDTRRSYGWARATGRDGTADEAWLETGDSYAFTVAAAVRAAEGILGGAPHGAHTPADAFGADFPLQIPDTSRSDAGAPSGT